MTYGDHTVVLPRDEKLFALYCRNIGYTAADVKRLWPQHCDQTDLRVSTKHFDPVDVEDSGLLRGGIPNAYDGSHGSRSSKEFSIVGRRRDWPKTKVPASTVDILRCDTVRKQKGGTTLARKQHLPVTTGPRLEIAERVLGPLFEDDGPDEFRMFAGWLGDTRDTLAHKRVKREKFIESFMIMRSKRLSCILRCCARPLLSSLLMNANIFCALRSLEWNPGSWADETLPSSIVISTLDIESYFGS